MVKNKLANKYPLATILILTIILTFSFTQIAIPKETSHKKGHLVVIKTSDKKVKELTQKLKQAYKNLDTLEAKFYQQTWASGSTQPIKAQGSVWLKRPNLMKWQYIKPYKQLIVAGLRDVYIYQPEQKQVMIIPRNR